MEKGRKIVIALGTLVVVNSVIDLFGIYLPLREEFSIGYLAIFMGLFFLASTGGLLLWIWGE